MTSEIVVMNQSAVAIAADSAVTIGDKTYNTANKLFMLSNQCPIGIMIYGNHQLMDISWETIIKMYRSKSKKIRFSKVSDYAKEFLKFFDEKSNNFKSWFPEQRQNDFFLEDISSIFSEIRLDIDENIEAAARKAFKDDVNFTEEHFTKLYMEVIEETIKEAYDEWDGCKYLKGYDKKSSNEISKKYKDDINKKIQDLFKDYPISSKSVRLLIKICGYMYTKDSFLPTYSGIVIVGFGEDEVFPTLISLKFDRIVNNRLKYKRDRKISINCRKRRDIVTFAQNETIDTFLSGVDPEFQETLIKTLRTLLLVDYPKVVINELNELNQERKNELTEKLKIASEGPLTKLIEFINLHTNKNSQPLHEAAEVIPKGDLAFMAEALINLTSFKRKYSMNQRETVAGPIDVAVISKGDGFIWIKRKHYFDIELNPHYLARYYNRKDEIVKQRKYV
jgi:hypothetical protein